MHVLQVILKFSHLQKKYWHIDTFIKYTFLKYWKFDTFGIPFMLQMQLIHIKDFLFKYENTILWSKYLFSIWALTNWLTIYSLPPLHLPDSDVGEMDMPVSHVSLVRSLITIIIGSILDTTIYTKEKQHTPDRNSIACSSIRPQTNHDDSLHRKRAVCSWEKSEVKLNLQLEAWSSVKLMEPLPDPCRGEDLGNFFPLFICITAGPCVFYWSSLINFKGHASAAKSFGRNGRWAYFPNNAMERRKKTIIEKAFIFKIFVYFFHLISWP